MAGGRGEGGANSTQLSIVWILDSHQCIAGSKHTVNCVCSYVAGIITLVSVRIPYTSPYMKGYHTFVLPRQVAYHA